MKPINLNARVILGKPESMTDKECDPLPVHTVEINGRPGFRSTWELSVEEVRQLVLSRRIQLTVLSMAHPPVLLEVVERVRVPDELSQFTNELVKACKDLLTAPHQEHFAVRLNDQEMSALNRIKGLVENYQTPE